MRREWILYSVLLVLSLGLAFQASRKDETVMAGEVPVVAISEEALTSITYRDSEHEVTAGRIASSDRYLLNYKVTIAPKSEKPKTVGSDLDGENLDEMAGDGHDHDHDHDHDAGQDANPDDDRVDPATSPSAGELPADAATPGTPMEAAAPAEVKVESHSFVASQTFNTFLTSLSPLYATRVFEGVSPEKLAEFGLNESPAVLEFARRNAEPIRLLVGEKTYGSDARFVQVENDPKKRVYVIDGGFVASLKKAKARLFEKEMLSKSMQEFSGVVVQAQSKTRKLRADKDASGLVKDWLDEEGQGQSGTVSYKNWLEKLEKVTITDYSAAGPETLENLVFSTTFQMADGKVEQLDFYTKSLTANSAEKSSYFVFVHSLNAIGVIPAARVATIEKDVGNILPQ
jgi:hypothetical protein